ncbi:uncharacterized protein LOC112166686 isoform X3 [Rosa chinensis]|uniref:uncharacterized protein LOC112166686 isoform X3 n=1 Tax=Rosa chinensis TaxID=74649 RepID=UPI000D08FD3F|nr:uncharacterized protein LOC112166686 isoform X3 [Rosa chinensis]
MSQPKPIMAYQRSNRGEQEWRVGSIDRNQMDMLIQIRGSPGQLRELFQGSPGGHYGTTRSIRGNDRSICEPDYSSNSGKKEGLKEKKKRFLPYWFYSLDCVVIYEFPGCN